MSPCPVCGSEGIANPPYVKVLLGGIEFHVCSNCGNVYNKEISKNYKVIKDGNRD